VLCLGLIAALAARDMPRLGWRWSGHAGGLGEAVETRHQRLESSASSPVSVFANGVLVGTHPEPYTTVPRTHLTMLLHPRPEHVLALGCLTDGSLPVVLSHPVSEVWLADGDPALPAFIARVHGAELRAALGDRRVRLDETDPMRALRRRSDWDLIAVLDGDPTTLRTNRTRTLEFVAECRRRLRPDGLLVLRTGVSDTYLGGASGRLLEVLVSTLHLVFEQVLAVPGEQVLLVAAAADGKPTLDPAVLASRWQDRGMATAGFVPEMLPILLDATRQPQLDAFVARADAPANTVAHPRAVLLAATRSEARTAPALLTYARALESRSRRPLYGIVIVVLVLPAAATALRRGAGPWSAAVVGFGSLTWTLLLLTAWQSTVGSVYAEVGALYAAFMAGVCAGGHVSRRWPRPRRALPGILVLSSALSVTLALGLPELLPVPLVPLLLVVAGGLTGAAFAGISELAGRGDTRRGTARGFAADEMGAAAAAVLIGLVALPWAGRLITALVLALVQAATIPAVLRAR
jgi:spermidine synthase